jgi:transcriptional regulator with XRE-family HTH domain
MASASRLDRHSPQRLAEKLLQIRLTLGLSQNELLRALGDPERLQQSSVSAYERGVRQPPLLILLAYARLVGVPLEVLVDDEQDLPKRLPTRSRAATWRRGGVETE